MNKLGCVSDGNLNGLKNRKLSSSTNSVLKYTYIYWVTRTITHLRLSHPDHIPSFNT